MALSSDQGCRLISLICSYLENVTENAMRANANSNNWIFRAHYVEKKMVLKVSLHEKC